MKLNYHISNNMTMLNESAVRFFKIAWFNVYCFYGSFFELGHDSTTKYIFLSHELS